MDSVHIFSVVMATCLLYLGVILLRFIVRGFMWLCSFLHVLWTRNEPVPEARYENCGVESEGGRLVYTRHVQVPTEDEVTRSVCYKRTRQLIIRELDLHGCQVREALSNLRWALWDEQRRGTKHFDVIAGWGKHSPDGPRIKLAVEDFLDNNGYWFTMTNEGRFTVYLHRSHGILLESSERQLIIRELDLHGCQVREALSNLRWALLDEDRRGTKHFDVITGWGKHSPNGPRIKPAVEDFLNDNGYWFKMTNAGRFTVDLDRVDVLVPESLERELNLHGYQVGKALSKLKWALGDEQRWGTKHFDVITGWGKHSPDGPRIKPAVEDFLNENGYRFTMTNKGRFTVYLDRILLGSSER